MNFDNLMTSDSDTKFAEAVHDINTRGKALDLDIQKYLVAVCSRWVETGDVRPAVNRINMIIDKKALFKGTRRNAIIAWVEAIMGFEYITEGENAHTVHANKAKASRLKVADLTKAENHWYNLTPQPEYKPLLLNTALKALVAKAEKRAANAKPDDDIPADQLAALKALVQADEQPAEQPDADAELAAAVEQLEDVV